MLSEGNCQAVRTSALCAGLCLYGANSQGMYVEVESSFRDSQV